MFEFIKKQSPVRVIALGFALVILLGSVLLIMPFSVTSTPSTPRRARSASPA